MDGRAVQGRQRPAISARSIGAGFDCASAFMTLGHYFEAVKCRHSAPETRTIHFRDGSDGHPALQQKQLKRRSTFASRAPLPAAE